MTQRLSVLADRRAGATRSQVVLAWLLRRRDRAVVPLVGPRTLDQLDVVLCALAVSLTDEQIARLERA